MKDRVSAKPNRYAVYDDAHNFVRYEYHERADEPTQAGDALNKANLLPDDVATALGLTGNPQVKDALLSLNTLSSTKAKIETASYTGTGTYGGSNRSALTFDFAPKIVIVHEKRAGGGYTSPNLMIVTEDSASLYGPGTANYQNAYVTAWGKTLTWYHSNSASHQFNASSFTYNVVAIG